MYKNQSNIDRKRSDRVNALPGLDLSYRKSADKVWSELSHSMGGNAEEVHAPTIFLKHRFLWAAAAVLFLLIGSGVFTRFYTTRVEAAYGEHLTARLPDGSEVELNAGTSIEYRPLWWGFKREVFMEGEAFFEVKKGKQFNVMSPNGITTVLGTSFNVYARDQDYQVTCYSGKIRVLASKSGHSLDIVSEEQATLIGSGSLRLSNIKNIEEPVSWRNEMFFFTSASLNKVFKELERQYAVTIEAETDLNYLYTGNFSRNQPVEQVLKMVCRPYGLSFREVESNYFIVND